MLDEFNAAGSGNSKIETINTKFETYSDAKLANLLFDEDISIGVMKKIFHIISDPRFDPQDVTFTGVLDMLEKVCSRRQCAVERELRTHPFKTDRLAVTTASNIPPTALELVVNKMLEDSVPLHTTAMEPYWKDSYADNGLSFRNMSVVSRSWTSIAQKALRRRVVVPYHRIDRFLVSPLCGPWIKEMVIYWAVDHDDRSVTKDDVLLLEALLKRAPNVHSLSFNTCLVYTYQYHSDDSEYEPSLDVNDCLNALSELPNLKRLWLKHFRRHKIYTSTEEGDMDIAKYSLDTCPGLRSLCARLPKFQSLEFLSIWEWSSPKPSSGQPACVGFDEHPSSRLKTLELDGVLLFYNVKNNEDDLIWLLEPRGEYYLQSLSIGIQDMYEQSDVFQETLERCFSGLLDLQLYSNTDPSNFRWLTLVAGCKKLNNLDLFVDGIDKLDPPILPSSLKHWALHLRDLELDSHSRVEGFFRRLEVVLPQLPLLQDILITTSPRMQFPSKTFWGLRLFGCLEEENGLDSMKKFVRSLMDKYNIEVSCTQVTFPKTRQLYFL